MDALWLLRSVGDRYGPPALGVAVGLVAVVALVAVWYARHLIRHTPPPGE
jgi:hypothetical protein